MTMRRFLIAVVAPLVLVLWHPQAQAGFQFGTSEHIRFVANITLQGPQGERLYLGRKVAQKSFILPYTVRDDGFVLGISGESKRYYPLPQGQQLEAIQRAGHLPTPLPEYELETFDLIFGHALWLTLIGFAVFGAYKHLTRNRQRAPAAARPASHPVAQVDRPSSSAPANVRLPMRLQPRRLKTIGLLAICIAFVVVGFLMSGKEPVMGYLCVGLFGLGIPVFLAQLLPGRSYLELTKNGFTVASPFRRTTIKWQDVAGFAVATISRNQMVGWRFSKAYAGQATSRKLSGALTGVEGVLPDTYGMKAEELAGLMNGIKNQVGNVRTDAGSSEAYRHG